MKVYMYYLIDQNAIQMLKDRSLMDWLGISNDDVKDACLYAYTKKKKISDNFEKTRNMKIFLKKVKEMDDDEFSSFESNVSSYARLSMAKVMYPFTKEALMFDDGIACKLALTSSESWFVIDNYKESIMDFLYALPKIPDIRIFRDDVYQTLKDMDYNDSVTRNDDYIKTHESISKLAEYSCYYAWENTIGIILCLYNGFFDEESIVEVIANGETE